MKTKKTGTKADKTYNSFRIIRKILQSGPLTRNELAESLNMSNAMALNRVNELIEKEILSFVGFEEKGDGKAGRGRYNQLLDLNPACCFAISVTIADKKITVLITTMKLMVLEKITVDWNEENIDVAVNQIKGLVDRLIINSCLDKKKIVGISVAISSEYWDDFGGRIYEYNTTAEDFVQKLEKATGFTVYIMTMVASAALYQFNKLSSRNEDGSLIYIDITDPVHLAVVSYDNDTSQINTYTKNLSEIHFRGGESGNKKTQKYTSIFSADADVSDIIATGKCSCVDKLLKIKKYDSENKKQRVVYDVLCSGDEATRQVLSKKINEFVVVIYNISVFVGADKIIIANSSSNPLISNLLNDSLYELFEESIRERFKITTDPSDYIYLGNAFTVFTRGFSDFYKNLE